MDAAGTPILSLWASRPGAGDVAGAPDWPRIEGVAASPDEALARARAGFPGRDVLLLQAGASLPPAFATRLLAAWPADGLDVLSPLDAGWPLPAGFDADRACGVHDIARAENVVGDGLGRVELHERHVFVGGGVENDVDVVLLKDLVQRGEKIGERADFRPRLDDRGGRHAGPYQQPPVLWPG